MIMAWSKCDISVGETGASDAMASSLTSVGVIKDKSSTLETADGDALEMKATGGETVGYEKQEGTVTLTTRVIEPDNAFFTSFGIGDVDSDEDGTLSIQTLVVPKEFSVKVSPKNIGARGLMAPKTSVSISLGWSEEDGNFADVTFGILHGQQKDQSGKGYWFKYFTKKA